MQAVQCKMARAATGLGVRELATAAQVSADTVVRLERGELLKPRTVYAIRAALEAAGVEFTNGDAPGVRLRRIGPVTPAQVRAARSLLRWGINKLAASSRTTYHLVKTYEHSGRVAGAYLQKPLDDPLAAIRAALEEAGIELTNGDTPGVQLRGQAE